MLEFPIQNKKGLSSALQVMWIIERSWKEYTLLSGPPANIDVLQYVAICYTASCVKQREHCRWSNLFSRINLSIFYDIGPLARRQVKLSLYLFLDVIILMRIRYYFQTRLIGAPSRRNDRSPAMSQTVWPWYWSYKYSDVTNYKTESPCFSGLPGTS